MKHVNKKAGLWNSMKKDALYTSLDLSILTMNALSIMGVSNFMKQLRALGIVKSINSNIKDRPIRWIKTKELKFSEIKRLLTQSRTVKK